MCYVINFGSNKDIQLSLNFFDLLNYAKSFKKIVDRKQMAK
jgi:hypothetical protein